MLFSPPVVIDESTPNKDAPEGIISATFAVPLIVKGHAQIFQNLDVVFKPLRKFFC